MKEIKRVPVFLKHSVYCFRTTFHPTFDNDVVIDRCVVCLYNAAHPLSIYLCQKNKTFHFISEYSMGLSLRF